MHFVVFLACFAYAVLRYVVLGDVATDQLPLFVTNKAIAWTGLILLGLAPLLGERERRARTGVTAFGLLVAHAILSGLLLEPAYFAKFYRPDGRLDGYVELSLLLGVLALVLSGRLFLATTGNGEGPDAGNPRSSFRGYGRAVLLLSVLHASFLGSSTWLDHETWPGYLPPITMLSALCGLALLSARWRRALATTRGTS